MAQTVINEIPFFCRQILVALAVQCLKFWWCILAWKCGGKEVRHDPTGEKQDSKQMISSVEGGWGGRTKGKKDRRTIWYNRKGQGRWWVWGEGAIN